MNSLSQKLNRLGFVDDLFDCLESEKIDKELRQKLFVKPVGTEHLENENNSSILLADAGGGKTSCLFYIADKFSQKTLVVVYDNYEFLTPTSEITLSAHFSLLMCSVAASMLTLVFEQKFIFLGLPNQVRHWYWSFLAKFLGGTSINYCLANNEFEELRIDYDKYILSKSPPPFQRTTNLLSALQAILAQLKAHFEIQRILVLIDCVSFPRLNYSKVLSQILSPILNSHFLFVIPGIAWKFFLPSFLKKEISDTVGYQSGRLTSVELTWETKKSDQSETSPLLECLNRRLFAFSDRTYTNLTDLCSEELLRGEKIEVEREMLSLLTGFSEGQLTPRSLLLLTRQLFLTSEFTDGRISPQDWVKFKRSIQKERAEAEESKPAKQINRVSFIALLDEYFNNADLRSLCFDLDVDYDNIPGEIKKRKIEELYLKLSKDGRIAELVDHAKHRRSNAPWNEIYNY